MTGMRLWRTWCLALFVQLGWGSVQAQPETLAAEGSQITQYLSINFRTWGNKRPLLELPLPPGTWTLRHIETVRNNQQLEGRVFWLDQVEQGQVVGLIYASVWENGSRNWVPGARCAGTLLVRAREPGLNGGCFSVKASAFMTNSTSASQKRIRDMWDRAGLQYANRAIFLDGFFEKRGGAVVYLDYAVPTRALGIPDSIALNTSPERTLALAQAVQAFQAGAVEQWFRTYGESLNDHVMTSPSDRRLASSDKAPLLEMLRSAIAAHLTEEDRQAMASLQVTPPPKVTAPAPAATAVVPQAPSEQELARMRAEVAALREELERTRRAQAAEEAKQAEKPPEVPAPASAPVPAPTEQAAATPKPPAATVPPAPAQSRSKPATAAVRDVGPSKPGASAPAKGPVPEIKVPPVAAKPPASSAPRTPIPEIREVQPRPAPPVRKKPDQDTPEIKPVPQAPPKISM